MKFIHNEIDAIPLDSLEFRPTNGSWSAIECLEHLNLAFDWYIPRIRRNVLRPNQKEHDSYATGFFGDRMVSSMEPEHGEIKYPMKTFRNMNPQRSKRSRSETITKFKDYMEEFDHLLQKSLELDLGKIRVKSAIGNILRFKLGDCYRFLNAHNERHLLQCKKVLKVLATYQ